jgi:hypothetical protein
VPDPTLDAREQGHRHGREGSEADPDPARFGVLAAGQGANRLDPDVGRQDEEAEGDQLLGPPLGTLRADSSACEEPENDEAGERLDQRVGSEPNQGD